MKKKQNRNEQLEQIALKITNWIGTPTSIIIHTALFIIAFLFYFFGVPLDEILLVLTTIVSLEAIYLSLFIQLTVNKNTESLEDVGEDIEEIAEDVEGLEGEFDEIQEDVEGLEGNIKKMRQNMKELEEDIEDISEDIDKIADDETSEEELVHLQSNKSLKNIEKEILTLSTGILALKDDLEILKKTIK
jgi:peptidoglycan hydrolase CwlO-like protein